MERINLAKLQNGSDIRGIAMTGVDGEDVNLTPQVIKSIASALAVWVCNITKKNADELRIAIGYDSRLSGPKIKEQLETQLKKLGVYILDAGLASTPAMYMATVFDEYKCDVGIMVTASHLPWNRNGFKFFTKIGGLEKDSIKDILNVAQGLFSTSKVDDDAIVPHELTGTSEKINLMQAYSEYLQNIIVEQVGDELSGDPKKPLDGLHVVVDAGNGSGGFYAEQVLEPLGADISGSQFLSPDGNFPNHEPNPENKEAMASIKDAVLNNKADLGLIFDTDVDRSSAVDSKGRDISRNAIVALAAALIADDYPGTTVVTDSITSDGLNEFLVENLGLKHHRFKRGYKNVINESKKLNVNGVDSQLAIETSGHAAYKENAFLDDGAYLATKIVIKTAKLKAEGKGIDALIEDLKIPAEAEEFRFKILTEAYSPYGDKLIRELGNWIAGEDGMSMVEPNYEGVRIDFHKDSGNGWLLLRKSLHDPIIAVNAESEEEGGVKIIGKRLLEFLKGYDELDLSALESYCK